MKRKLLATLLCLAISVSMVACGSKDNSTEQAETGDTVEISESTETEVSVTETQEVQMQEEETDSFENYKELESVPVDGRDGSQEHPYQVGDTIYFPKIYMGYNSETLEKVYTSLTIVMEEVTQEHAKITYKFGVDSWEDLDWANWESNDVEFPDISIDRYFRLLILDKLNDDVVQIFDFWDEKNNYDYWIEDANETEVTIYYINNQNTEEMKYLVFNCISIGLPEEEHYPFFNWTFVEIQ